MADHLEVEVAIIGAGPGGITAAHHLRRNGIVDLVVLERASEVGGTWRDNHYPGLEVDIPSWWYQFQFAPNRNWSRFFAAGPEVHRYISETVEALGLTPSVRTNSEVTRQIWDDATHSWTLLLTDSTTVTAKYLINAVGGYLNAKDTVAIAGIDDFTGTRMRPNAWDDSFDVANKNVVIVGTGSSGAQITGALAGKARSLTVFQRTPAWAIPKINFDLPRWLNALMAIPGVLPGVVGAGDLIFDAFFFAVFHILPRLPAAGGRVVMRAYDRWCRLFYRLWLRIVVQDRRTRRALVPQFGIMAKRPVICTAYLKAFNNPTTELVTTPIERITPTGVRTIDGKEYPADLLVTATGYDLFIDPESFQPGTIVGRDGFDLALDYRRNGIRAYNGSSHPELPNRWDLVAAQGFQGIAWFQFVEMISEHAVRIISEARARGATATSVTRAAFDRWNSQTRQRGKTVRAYFELAENAKPSSHTYFINSHGEALFYRPQTMTGSRRFCRHSPLDDYHYEVRDRAHGAPTVDVAGERTAG